jgi:anti-sigma B factor antagonist
VNFDAVLNTVGTTATITLTGELDASTAPVLRSLVDRVATENAEHLTIDMADLGYMSSAGIRCLVYAHQSATPGADITLLDPQPEVAEVLKLAGLDRAIAFANAGPAR